MLTDRYKNEIDSGILNILMAPAYFYPQFHNLNITDITFNDSPERIKWRIKQNYDISYLMAYSINKGEYYLQVFLFLLFMLSFFNVIALN